MRCFKLTNYCTCSNLRTESAWNLDEVSLSLTKFKEDYQSALDWLSDAHLVNICRLCTDPNVGLRLNEEESSLKCYMADTGLLVSHTFADGPDTFNVHREIDFLITKGFSDSAGKLRICPIEVKSSKRYGTVSLDDFHKRFGKRIGDEIVLHPKQLMVEGHRQYLPLYMSFCV